MQPCKIFSKQEFMDTDLNKVVPRSYVKDTFSSLLYNIQRYFTFEGRYHKVYTYHFKLLLHFTGIISLDLPFFLFQILAKMADKVQMKNQACETSLFHHGLVKLKFFHELQKVKREWAAFIFLSGIGVEGTGAIPQVKETSSSKTTEPVETKSRRFVKLQPRKQVKELMIKTSLKIQRTPQYAQKKRIDVKRTIQEQSISKTA